MAGGSVLPRARWVALAAAAVAYAAASHALLTRTGDSSWSVAIRWFYLAEHAGVHLALALVFGSTLRPGREPLVSGIARRLHREFTPDLARYTRQVTLAWTAYFLGMAAVSLALFLSGAFAAWSLLANVLTPCLIASLFAGEYLLRYWLHPEFDRVGLPQIIEAYRSRGRP